MNEITDNKLLELGFKLTTNEKVEETGSHKWNVKTWIFDLEYNYYLHNKSRIRVVRSTGKFPQFDGYYWVGINHFKDLNTILLSKTKDYEALLNIVNGLTKSKNYERMD